MPPACGIGRLRFRQKINPRLLSWLNCSKHSSGSKDYCLQTFACYLLFHWELEGTGPLVVGGYLCKLCGVENIQGLQSIALAIWDQPESSLRGTRLSSYQIIQFASISLRRLGHPISSWYQTSGLLGEKLSYPSF